MPASCTQNAFSLPPVVELFSGCGGLALGFHAAGFQHKVLVERDKLACATLAENGTLLDVAVAELLDRDVSTLTWAQSAPLVVEGGPPCQPFSMGGRAAGPLDPRDMWPEAIRAVRELEPEGFLFENVKGLLRPAFSGYLAWIRASLESPQMAMQPGEPAEAHLARMQASALATRYATRLHLANAADYGVAQIRHRVFIAGLKAGHGILPPFPAPTHSESRLVWDKWVSGDYWRRHGLPMPALETASAHERRIARTLKSPPPLEPWRTCRDALRGLGDPLPGLDTDGTNHRLQPGARQYPGHTGSALDWPAKALKAGVHGVPGGENMLVLDDGTVRYFSVREAARLQGFPDDYRFTGSWSRSLRQLGNAVPVPLGKAAAEWLSRSLYLARHSPGPGQ